MNTTSLTVAIVIVLILRLVVELGHIEEDLKDM